MRAQSPPGNTSSPPHLQLCQQSGIPNPESVSVNHGQENWQSKPQPVINVRNQADASYSSSSSASEIPYLLCPLPQTLPQNTPSRAAVAANQAQQKPIRTTNAYAGTERNSRVACERDYEEKVLPRRRIKFQVDNKICNYNLLNNHI